MTTTTFKVGGANRPMCTNPDNPSLPQQVKPLLDIGLRGNGDPEPPRPQWEDPQRVYTMPHIGPSNSNGTIGTTKIVGAAQDGGGGEEENRQQHGKLESGGSGGGDNGNEGSNSPLFPAPNKSSKTAAPLPWGDTTQDGTQQQQPPNSKKEEPPLPQSQQQQQFVYLSQVPTIPPSGQQPQQQPVYIIAQPGVQLAVPGQLGHIAVPSATPYAPQPAMAVPLASSGVGGFSGIPPATPSGSIPFPYAQVGSAGAPPTSSLRPNANPFPSARVNVSQQQVAPAVSSGASAGTGGSHPFPTRHRMPAPR